MKQTPNSTTTRRFSIKIPASDFNSKVVTSDYLELPKKIKLDYFTGPKTAVEGLFNTLPFRSLISKSKDGKTVIKLSTAMKNTIKQGDTSAKVEITRLEDEPEVRIPADLKKALTRNLKAKKQWDEITPLARREWVLFIGTAKLEETRLKRIEKACDMLATGKKRVCCFPGLNWLTKDTDPTSETWAPLPYT
jgi:hypothetical protein